MHYLPFYDVVRRSIIVAALLMASLMRSAMSQQPVASLTAGVGDGFGVAGLRGEVFAARGRMSVVGGAGVVPWNPNRSRLNAAASARYYFSRLPHRLFIDASWTLLATRGPDDLVCTRVPADMYGPERFINCHGSPEHFDYGPGISLGYAFIFNTGLTLTMGAGVGCDVLYENDMRPLLQLGIGWTWRSHP